MWQQGSSLPQASLQTTSDGKVLRNRNDGSAPFDRNNDLEDVNKIDGTYSIKGIANFAITKDAQTIISNNSLDTPLGTYDLNLGDVNLEIANMKDVAPGEYQANVIWNIVEAAE